MPVDIIFILIIIIYGVMGAQRGFIRSIGGLISLLLSCILSKLLAAPIATLLFNVFHIEDKIGAYVSSVNTAVSATGGTITDSLTTFRDIINMTSIDISEPTEKVIQAVSELVNKTAMNIGSTFIAIILFTIFMFIFGAILRCFETVFKTLPLGNTLNMILGFSSGIIKGIIIVIIAFYIFTVLNYIPGVNIPLEGSTINNILQGIGGLFLNAKH